MARYTWIVMTNCTEGKEAEYEQWYDDVHVHDLMRIPGITAVQRGEMAPEQQAMVEGEMVLVDEVKNPYRYVAFYTFETEDPQSILEEVARRANTPDLMVSEHLIDAHTVLYRHK